MTEPMTTRWFELEPVDAWFFRDGRPSNRGEDQSDLASVFPPHAITIAGALRAALARAQGWPGHGDWSDGIKRILGDGFDDLGGLTFTGPFLKRCDELLFPMPRHVLGTIDEVESCKEFTPTAWLQPEPIRCDHSTDGEPVHLPIPPQYNSQRGTKPPAPAEGFFVTTRGMVKILAGELPDKDHSVHRESLFRHESRVGIAFNRERPERRITGEGEIYSPCYVRLVRGVSLAVGVKGLPYDWSVPELLPLGGESRLAGCHELKKTPPTPPQILPGAGRSHPPVLILLTPAHFEGDESTAWIGAGPGEPASQLNSNLSGNVCTAAIDRPVRVGGWDFRKGPRPLEPFVPAGSVWWLNEAAADPPARLGAAPHTAYGYGHALLASRPENGL